MLTYTKITLAAAFILSAASAAFANGQTLASNNYDSPAWAYVYAPPSATFCPTLEGYPDCHPDSHASGDEYSAGRRLPTNGRSSYERRP